MTQSIFFKNFEQRKHPRKKCDYLPVDYSYNDRLHSGLIMDLSESGARIETNHPVIIGDSSTMTFMENFHIGPVKANSHVVRQYHNGFAVAFENLTLEQEFVIGNYLGH